MAKFLIEHSHEGNPEACARAVELLLRRGSHFFGQADWGCKDGEHKAWIIVDVDSKEEARRIVPSAFHARVFQLNQFSMDDLEGMLSKHKTQGGNKGS